MTKNIAGTLVWQSDETLLLGENPLWDALADTLYFIDSADPAVYRRVQGRTDRYPMPKPVASIFLGEPDRLIVAMRNQFALLNLQDGRLANIDAIRPPSSEERFNDGRCDAQHRIWISTMDRRLQSGIGSLARVGADFTSASFKTGAKLGNGVCFSPDGTWMYFSDTAQRAIYRYPVTSSGVQASGKELLVRLDDTPGRPDGCSVDAEGCLWSARVGGGRIDRYSPDGQLLGYLAVPVSHPTHCTFGGKDLRTLFVTSSRYPATSEEFDHQPDAGKVLAFEIDTQGLPEARFMIDPAAAPA